MLSLCCDEVFKRRTLNGSRASPLESDHCCVEKGSPCTACRDAHDLAQSSPRNLAKSGGIAPRSLSGDSAVVRRAPDFCGCPCSRFFLFHTT